MQGWRIRWVDIDGRHIPADEEREGKAGERHGVPEAKRRAPGVDPAVFEFAYPIRSDQRAAGFPRSSRSVRLRASAGGKLEAVSTEVAASL